MDSKQNKNVQDALSPGWLTAGALLFFVAVSTPLVALNFLPDVHALNNAAAADLADEGGALAEEADGQPEYPEIVLVESGAQAVEQMGSLATLIDAQGSGPSPVGASAVRRMVLDAVLVDLETSVAADTLEHLRVPIQDCDATANTSNEWLVPDGARINAALQSLPAERSFAPEERIAGPVAQSFSVSHQGLRVEYCPDLNRIKTVEILPVEPAEEPTAASLVAELQPQRHAPFDKEVTGIVTATVAVEIQDHATPAQVMGNTANLASALPISPEAALTDVPSTERVPELRAGQSELPEVDVLREVDVVSVPIDGIAPKALIEATPQERPSAQMAVRTPSISSVDTALLALHGDAYGVSTDVSPIVARPDQIRLAPNDPLPVLAQTAAVSDDTSLTLPVSGYETAEADLKLTRAARWRTQLRLSLIGHDPKGIDGIFGDGTRGAIASLQRAESLLETGYLDKETLAVLNRKSQRRYAGWLDQRAKRKAQRLAQELVAASAPQQVRTAPAARRAPECARDSKGVIISNQSIGCDLSVLREGLGSLFGSSS